MRERVRSGYTVEDSCDIRVFLEKFELLRDLFQEIRLFFKKKKTFGSCPEFDSTIY
jgi:hypothetical protein